MINLATVARPRVTVYFDQETLDLLTQWANEETRTIGNLVEHLATKALRERLEKSESQEKDK
jgi:hypothetical protein